MSEAKRPRDRLREKVTIGGLKSFPIRYLAGIGFFVWLAIAPSIGQMGVLDMLQWTAALFFLMFVISWDFVVGYTGQVSFGHTLFFAAGGYTTALLNLQYGVDPFVGIVAGTLVATVSGLIYAIPALRLEGHYLALFTLLPPIILLRLFRMFRDFTGGTRGLPNPDPLLDQGGFVANARIHYYLAVVLLLFIFGLAWLITRSDTGKIFTAIRESEDAVESAGFNPAKYKVYAMLLSAAMGGLAGAVFVHTPAGSASPSQLLELVVMIEILLAAIIGGFGTISGGIVGGLLVYWGMETFATSDFTIPLLDIPLSDVNQLVFFGLLLLLLYLLAEGILPWTVRQGTRVRLLIRGEDPSRVVGSQGNPWFERKLSAVWEERTDARGGRALGEERGDSDE